MPSAKIAPRSFHSYVGIVGVHNFLFRLPFNVEVEMTDETAVDCTVGISSTWFTIDAHNFAAWYPHLGKKYRRTVSCTDVSQVWFHDEIFRRTVCKVEVLTQYLLCRSTRIFGRST